MCTYLTEKIAIDGSGKGARGYFTLTDAMVYVDHPQHAPHEHTVNIDFLNPAQGPAARMAGLVGRGVDQGSSRDRADDPVNADPLDLLESPDGLQRVRSELPVGSAGVVLQGAEPLLQRLDVAAAHALMQRPLRRHVRGRRQLRGRARPHRRGRGRGRCPG